MSEGKKAAWPPGFVYQSLRDPAAQRRKEGLAKGRATQKKTGKVPMMSVLSKKGTKK